MITLVFISLFLNSGVNRPPIAMVNNPVNNTITTATNRTTIRIGAKPAGTFIKEKIKRPEVKYQVTLLIF